MKKKILTVSIMLVLIFGLVLIGPSVYLRLKFPEYYNLDTFKGIEVYVWQNEAGEYRCSAMSGTNRGKTIEELTALAENSASIEEMKWILSSYKNKKDRIIIFQVDSGKFGALDVVFRRGGALDLALLGKEDQIIHAA